MNNDMSDKLDSHFDTQKEFCVDNLSVNPQTCRPLFLSDENMVNDIFGVNCVSKSVQNSVKEFLENPEIIEAYIDMCDEFVERGSCLREAVDKTDRIFNILKEKKLYE